MDEELMLLRSLVDLRDRTIQKSRIAYSNRVFAVTNGTDSGPNEGTEMIMRWSKRFEDLEDEATNDISKIAKKMPIVKIMTEVKGVGLTLAAKVISMIDIEQADTVSALWRYCGYAVIDGAREKPTKGEKLHYNSRLKSSCYLVGTSFLKSNSPYRKIYDEAREFYEANRTDWTKGHQHNAAMRKMIKVWLAHLWYVWRELEGLPTRDLYAAEHQGHNHYRASKEFGWPEIEAIDGE